MKIKFPYFLFFCLLAITIACSKQTADDLFKKASSHLDKGDVISAKTEFMQFLASYPDDPKMPNAVLNLAVCHILLEEYDFAEKLYLNLANKFKGTKYEAEALFQVAKLYENQQNWDKAVKAYNEILKNPTADSRKVEILSATAGVYVKSEDWEKAIETYNSALKIEGISDDYKPYIYLYLARSYKFNNDLKFAMQTYRKLYQEFPQNDVAIWGKVEESVLYNDQELFAKQKQDILNIYQDVIDSSTTEPERQVWAMCKIADAYDFWNDKVKSIEALETALQFSNKHNVKIPQVRKKLLELKKELKKE